MYRYGDPSAGVQEFRTCLRRVLSTSATRLFINLATTIALLPLAVVCVASSNAIQELDSQSGLGDKSRSK